jgi:hypothetical protein
MAIFFELPPISDSNLPPAKNPIPEGIPTRYPWEKATDVPTFPLKLNANRLPFADLIIDPMQSGIGVAPVSVCGVIRY